MTEDAAGPRHVRPLRSVHNVTPGETITSVAQMYGLSAEELIQNNAHTIGRDGVIHAGMRLEVG